MNRHSIDRIEPEHGTAPVSTSAPVEHARGDGWCLRQDRYEADRRERDGTLFCLANGVLGVRGGGEEDGGSGGCFLAEAYERSPIHYHERFTGFAGHTDTRVPVADGSAIAIEVDGGFRLRPGDPACIAFERELDLRSGCLRRRLRWRCPSGGEIELCSERVVPFDRAALLAIRVTLRSFGYRGGVRLESLLSGERAAPAQGDDPRIGVGAGAGLATLELDGDERGAWLLQAAAGSAIRVGCGQAHRIADGGLRFDGARRGDGVATQVFGAHLAPGESLCLEKFVAYAWTDPGEAMAESDAVTERLRQRVGSALDEAGRLGFAALAAEQARALERFWRDAEVAIDADDGSAAALRFDLFHLLQSTGRGGRASTAAKGLTGDGYEGHYFWDTEVYMLPVLALTAPELARGMLEYRCRTLDAARRHAREMNHHQGALYAWRTISGDECSAYYPSGSAQYHINAAIAYAVRVYRAATGDFDFLLDGGAEMLFETARIWLSIGHFNPRRGGAFCLCEVTGPDEYSALVDNNFYTNRMARAHLFDAVAVWRELGTRHPAVRERLARELALGQAEVERWRQAAEAMYLPYDRTLGIHPQDDGFLDKPRWDFDNTPTSHYPLLLHYHPLSLYRHQVCKQADVVLALVVDGADVEPEVKRRCFDYYARTTVHDSTLSAAPFGILAAELDLAETATAFFEETLRVDLDDLHGNTDHGAHMAAMAGAWQCFAFGFAGLRLDGEALRFAPRLPAGWRGYRLRLRWRDRRIELTVSPEASRYRLLEGAAMTLFDHGRALPLAIGASVEAPLPTMARWPLLRPARPFEAVIFDLDGVLTDTAEIHYQAWKRLADELGIAFDRTVNRRLKGVDRATSLDILIEAAGTRFDQTEKARLAERKNGYYRERIAALAPADLLPGALAVLDAARAAGLKLGLASASRNAPLLLERLGIADRFDYLADPAALARGKPDPEIFLVAARGLGVDPEACLGIEDAAAGIAAIKAAGMTALGIGRRQELPGADAVLAGLSDFRIETIPVAGSGGR